MKNHLALFALVTLLLLVLSSCLPATQHSERSITGIWHGVGQQNNNSSWTIELEISKTIAVGDLDAVISYPSLNCGGIWKFISQTNTSYIFEEELHYGQDVCIDGGTVTISLNSDDSLNYLYESGADTASSTLKRKVSDKK